MKTTPRYALQNLYLDRDQVDTLVSTYALSRGYRYGFNGMEKDDEAKGRGNSYDFGARMYDSRLGRFLSRDPSFALQPSEGTYNFAGNSPIVYIDYQGNFKWPGTEEEQKLLENKYPNITKVLKNIHKLANEYPILIDKLAQHTGLTTEEIKHNLQYGNGAEIIIVSTGSKDEAAFGFFSAVTPNTKDILIRELTINDVENATGDDLYTGMFALSILLIHEEVHRGDRLSNNGKISGQWSSRRALPKKEGERQKYDSYTGPNTRLGNQEVKMSPTGHRGSDIEVEVFGAPQMTSPVTGGTAGFTTGENHTVDRSAVMKSNSNMTNTKLKNIYDQAK